MGQSISETEGEGDAAREGDAAPMPVDVDGLPETAEAVANCAQPGLGDYALLLKPRVMSLVVFSGFAGLYLAPGPVDLLTAVAAILFIAVGAGGSGAINMWYDRDIDRWMSRTKDRPIPAGRMSPGAALWTGIVLSVGSVVGMAVLVNYYAAWLLAGTIAYYVFIYTMWLKRRTPQNIVIGGGSGALPPMIGWAAVTGQPSLDAWVLFLIIFMWTPPHFWALALFRCGDYARAGVPMLPVVKGIRETKKQILAYSIAMLPVSLLPVATGMGSYWYGAAAAVLSALLIHHAVRVWNDTEGTRAKPMFLFTILYLFLVYLALILDKAVAGMLAGA